MAITYPNVVRPERVLGCSAVSVDSLDSRPASPVALLGGCWRSIGAWGADTCWLRGVPGGDDLGVVEPILVTLGCDLGMGVSGTPALGVSTALGLATLGGSSDCCLGAICFGGGPAGGLAGRTGCFGAPGLAPG